MASGIELSVLSCPQCMGGLSGASHAVLLYCANCSSGFEIKENDQLSPVTVYFARTRSDAKESAPFWAFDSKLDLIERVHRGNIMSLVQNVAGMVRPSSSGGGLSRLFEERGTIRFYVPGSFASLSIFSPVALNLTYQQPELEYLNPDSKIPDVSVTQDDARTLADHLFVKSEVDRKDNLLNLTYNLYLENPFLICVSL